MRVAPAPVRRGQQGLQNGRAERRPATAEQLPAAARLVAARLPEGHPIRQAMEVLQLRQMPASLPELRQHCSRVHPNQELSWAWHHAQAYRLLFDLISAGTGSQARSIGGPVPAGGQE